MPAGSTYTPIATTTLGSSQANVTFSSLGSYTDLVLVINSKSTVNDDIYLQFNNDTGGNYSSTWIRGTGSAASSVRVSNTTGMRLSDQGSPTTSNNTTSIIQIMNYGNASTYKTVLARSNNSSVGLEAVVGLWRSTSAITSIKIYLGSGSWESAGTFTIYGIASA